MNCFHIRTGTELKLFHTMHKYSLSHFQSLGGIILHHLHFTPAHTREYAMPGGACNSELSWGLDGTPWLPGCRLPNKICVQKSRVMKLRQGWCRRGALACLHRLNNVGTHWYEGCAQISCDYVILPRLQANQHTTWISGYLTYKALPSLYNQVLLWDTSCRIASLQNYSIRACFSLKWSAR